MKLERLLPVDVHHVDVAALLQELSMLCNEVRLLAGLHNEIEDVCSRQDCQTQLQHHELSELKLSVKPATSRCHDEEFPALVASTNATQ